MSMILPDLPNGIAFGTITGTFLTVLADSSDTGNSPDAVALGGTVTITPVLKSFRITGAAPATVVTQDIKATIVNGTLLGPDGVTPLRVMASDSPNISPSPVQYTAKFALTGVTNQPPTITFSVPSNGTVDLSTVITLPAVAPVQTIVSEQDRLDAEAAAVRAEAAQANSGFVVIDNQDGTLSTTSNALVVNSDGTLSAANITETWYSKATVDSKTSRPILDVALGTSEGSASKFTLPGTAFTTINMDTIITDTANGFSLDTSRYTFAEGGTYLIIAKLRPVDNTGNTGQANLGLGVHTSNADFPGFVWSTTGAPSTNAIRWVMDYQRIAYFNAGDSVSLFAYADIGPGTLSIASAALTLVKVA